MAPDIEAIAEQVFTALADPTRRAILAALASEGPATATDLAGRLPITRQAITKHLALLAEAGLVTAEPGERRRVRYRLRSAPMQVAQQFLAALARDWDGPLGALKDHLDRSAHEPATPLPGESRGHPDPRRDALAAERRKVWTLARSVRGRAAGQTVDEYVDEHPEPFIRVGEAELAGQGHHGREQPGRQRGDVVAGHVRLAGRPHHLRPATRQFRACRGGTGGRESVSRVTAWDRLTITPDQPMSEWTSSGLG
jgi:DNA-binding transcriptional ArsR family regulator